MPSPESRRRNRSRSPHRRNENRDDRRQESYRESKEHYSGKSRPSDRRNEVSQSASRRYREETRREEISNSRERQKGRDRQRYESPARERTSHNRDEGAPGSAEEDSRTESNVQAEGPNYSLSGKLTEYTNTYKGVVIKYNEPPEARKPRTRWRLYPFKGDQAMSVMYIHRQSAYLIGRQRHVVDIAVDHPSCSKQHAVLQYRLVDFERADGTASKKVKPYIIDLDSSNGTFLNNQQIEPRRYYELKEKDVLKFGFSTREYVILTEKSQDVEDEIPGEDGT